MALVNLKKEMAAKEITIESIANLLHVHRNTVANRLDGVGKFSIEEGFAIKQKFFPDLGIIYLFESKKD